MDASSLQALRPDHVFDGGDLDCGSGLVLLLREHMQRVPVGGVLEMRSREPTVRDDLPPWCRMAGHALLGHLETPEHVRWFLRRGEGGPEETARLAEDKARADAYEWRVRVRATGPLRSTAYCRNFAFDVGQPASFEERDRHPSAVEVLLGSLGASLATGFSTECARDGLAVDDVEVTVKGRLGSVLAHLGLADGGDPALAAVEVRGFVSSREDEPRLRAVWDRTVARSPVAATLARATALTVRLSVL